MHSDSGNFCRQNLLWEVWSGDGVWVGQRAYGFRQLEIPKKKKKDGGDNIVYKILIFHFRASCKEGKEKRLLSVSPTHQFTQVGTAEPQLLSEKTPLKVGLSPDGIRLA